MARFISPDAHIHHVRFFEAKHGEEPVTGISAALAGQLVLTSLHSSNAAGTIERLAELGMKRHAVATGLSGVLAQRLVRRLCTFCRRPSSLSHFEAQVLGVPLMSRVYDAGGCSRCGESGYVGRIAIFELMTVSDAIRSAIVESASPVRMAELARNCGFEPMVFDGARRALAGETSVAELRRVLSLDAVQ